MAKNPALSDGGKDKRPPIENNRLPGFFGERTSTLLTDEELQSISHVIGKTLKQPFSPFRLQYKKMCLNIVKISLQNSNNKTPQTPDCFFVCILTRLISRWISSTCCRRETQKHLRGWRKYKSALLKVENMSRKSKHVTQVDRQMLEVCAARKHQNNEASSVSERDHRSANAEAETSKGESDALIPTFDSADLNAEQTVSYLFIYLGSFCEPTIRLPFLHSLRFDGKLLFLWPNQLRNRALAMQSISIMRVFIYSMASPGDKTVWEQHTSGFEVLTS